MFEAKGGLVEALNSDVVVRILDLLARTSPKSLLNVALTSKNLYSLAESLLYRTIKFRLSSFNLLDYQRLFQRLLDKQNFYTHIQDIEFLPPISCSYDRHAYDEILGLLSILVSKASSLKRLTWGPGIAITKGMLESIVTFRPRCHLHNQVCGVWETYVTLSQTRHNPRLTSLAVTLSDLQFKAFGELQVMAYSCPNLSRLSITIEHGSDRSEAEHLQWQDHTHRPLVLHTLELDGFCPGVAGGSALAVMTDVSSLEHLSIVNVPSVPSLDCGNLKSLRIALNGNQNDDSAEVTRMTAFLYLCKFLEELDLTGFTTCFDPRTFEHLGKSLKILRLHEYERKTGLQLRPVLSPEAILTLGVKFPRLDILGLDMAYRGQWPYHILECLTQSLWFLTKLELNLEINISDPDRPLQPAATMTSVTHLWNDLWARMKKSRQDRPWVCAKPRLRQLDVNAGSFRPLQSSGYYTWEESQQQRFQARLSERDDEAEHGFAKIICLEVEDLRHSFADETSIKNAIIRARHGPGNDPKPDYFLLAMERAAFLATPGY